MLVCDSCVLVRVALRLYRRKCSLFFFFKQKTAYEMRISDWSSDVCSSDLAVIQRIAFDTDAFGDVREWQIREHAFIGAELEHFTHGLGGQIGRASCRERVCQYV